MTYPNALALFAVMSMDSQNRVVRIFDLIRASFPDFRDAFVQAMDDEALVIETEMLLLETNPAPGMMQ